MVQLNLPPFDPKIKQVEGKSFIFDRLRRKYVALTPEEWVRQHVVNYLISERGYPESLLANEIQIALSSRKKRCDTVVYSREALPLVIVEYKAPDVRITQNVFDQISRYNIALKVGYLIVSNGLNHYCCKVDYEAQQIAFLQDIPYYDELI